VNWIRAWFRRYDAKPPRRRPRNVRVLLSTGDHLPLSLCYDGRDWEGNHVWFAPTPGTLLFESNAVAIVHDGIPRHHVLFVIGKDDSQEEDA
jgi:hypothetical protein